MLEDGLLDDQVKLFMYQFQNNHLSSISVDYEININILQQRTKQLLYSYIELCNQQNLKFETILKTIGWEKIFFNNRCITRLNATFFVNSDIICFEKTGHPLPNICDFLKAMKTFQERAKKKSSARWRKFIIQMLCERHKKCPHFKKYI